MRVLDEAYKRCPYGESTVEIVRRFLSDSSIRLLADVNIAIIKEICRKLRFDTRFFLASELACGGKRSEHLLKICQAIGADHYLSPPGSKSYLEEDGEFLNNMDLSYHHHTPAPYPQKFTSEFISHLSILDMLANIGSEASRNILR